MAFRSSHPYSFSDAPRPESAYSSSSSPDPMRKRQRTLDMHGGAPGQPDPIDANSVGEGAFIADHDAIDSAGDDDDDDDKPKSGQKQGRRKIKIEFIQDKSRRHITFSKRKAGRYYEKGNFSSSFIQSRLIALQAYELSTLTGTQVLLLVVSETGLVQKARISSRHVSMHPTAPSHRPCPLASRLGVPQGPWVDRGVPPVSNNMPGGLSISGGATNSSSKDEDDPNDDDESAHGGRASAGDKRRRRSSATNPSSTGVGAPLLKHTQQRKQRNLAPCNLCPATAEHPRWRITAAWARAAVADRYWVPDVAAAAARRAALDVACAVLDWWGGYHPGQGQPQHHQPQHDSSGMGYPSHLMSPTNYSYPQGSGGPPPQQGAGGQPLGGLAAAAAQHSHWGSAPQGQVQGGAYGRR
ncbi:Serum response factor A [Mycena sanguinolenta]|uniref:Serum response factor A n=1 Tax=Mycena sanguinolenta TaxID=230812 RepID=A0A8H7CT28_9AGAR|nr:Serum response factor A [Mycena sanguinolenta]